MTKRIKLKLEEEIEMLYAQLDIKEAMIKNYTAEIEIQRQQLSIAVEQLKDTYAICFRNKDSLLHTPEHNIIGGIERDCAIALQKIKKKAEGDF